MAQLSLKTRRMLARGLNIRHAKLLGGRTFRGIGNRATLTTALAGANNDITLIARTPGTGGNAINFTITAPAAPVKAVQTIALGAATAGTFTLTLPAQIGGGTTAAIAYTATAAQVQSAILATGGVPANAVTAAGGPLPGTGVSITFNTTVGAVGAIVINGGGLTGATPTVTQTTVGSATVNSPFSVSVAGNAITAAAATDATGVVSTTANALVTAMLASIPVKALVWSQVAVPGNDGTGVVVAQAATNLAGAV